MSLQFGKFNFNGVPPESNELDQVRGRLARYSPDPEGSYSDQNVQIIYRAFCTTEDSQHEKQPYVSQSGVVVSWDGRLDNRNDLISEIGGRLSNRSSDVEIVATAYDRFSTDCFQKFVGDWALSLWVPRAHTVFLATDFVGTRDFVRHSGIR
jgi:asparagine synthase (glutamine-hydrolysing)